MTVKIDEVMWEVVLSGRLTQYDRDEFALVFSTGTGADRQVRVTRYSPLGSRFRQQSLAEMTDDELRRLFEMSQPGSTSPEAGYVA